MAQKPAMSLALAEAPGRQLAALTPGVRSATAVSPRSGHGTVMQLPTRPRSIGEGTADPVAMTDGRQDAGLDDPEIAGLRVLVVADRTAKQDAVVGLLRRSPCIGVVYSARDAADALRLVNRRKVDLAVVDTNLPGLDGVDLARVLTRFDRPPAIIFIADDRTRALDAFEVGAVDFLLGEVSPARLAQSLQRVQRLAVAEPPATQPQHSPHTRNASALRIPIDPLASSVRWLQAEGDYVRAYTATGSLLMNVSMSNLVEAWGHARIVRIHRSYAVQLAAVSEMRVRGNGYVVVVDGRELPVSRRSVHVLKERLVGG
jgi:DNA-binding LytR/AlgR family response regulator